MIGKKTVVYTSGTFDLLHSNHLKMLKYARSLGDILIVGVNTDELVVRSQNKVLSIFHNKKRPGFNKMQDLISKNLAEGFDEAKASVFAAEKCYPDLMPYFKTGIPAKYSKLLKQKKQALEYIYPHHIPIDDVQKIGEVNLPDFRQSAEYDKSHPMKSIFKQLLKDTPESKALCLLN